MSRIFQKLSKSQAEMLGFFVHNIIIILQGYWFDKRRVMRKNRATFLMGIERGELQKKV